MVKKRKQFKESKITKFYRIYLAGVYFYSALNNLIASNFLLQKQLSFNSSPKLRSY